MSHDDPSHEERDTVPLPGARSAANAEHDGRADVPVAAPVAPPARPRPSLTDWLRRPVEPRIPTTRADLRAAGIVVAALAFVGLPLGVLWRVLTPRVELLRVAGGFTLTQENPEEYAAADAMFVIIMLAAGVVAGIVVWASLPRRRGTLVLAALAVGSVACSAVAWRFGRIGRDAYQATLADGEAVYQVGWRLWRVPELMMVDVDVPLAMERLGAGDLAGMWSHLSLGVLAVMGLVAVTLYTLCAAWSRFTSLRRDQEPVVPDDSPSTLRNAEASRD